MPGVIIGVRQVNSKGALAPVSVQSSFSLLMSLVVSRPPGTAGKVPRDADGIRLIQW